MESLLPWAASAAASSEKPSSLRERLTASTQPSVESLVGRVASLTAGSGVMRRLAEFSEQLLLVLVVGGTRVARAKTVRSVSRGSVALTPVGSLIPPEQTVEKRNRLDGSSLGRERLFPRPLGWGTWTRSSRACGSSWMRTDLSPGIRVPGRSVRPPGRVTTTPLVPVLFSTGCPRWRSPNLGGEPPSGTLCSICTTGRGPMSPIRGIGILSRPAG